MNENKKDIIEGFIEKVGELRSQTVNELFSGEAVEILEKDEKSVEENAAKITKQMDEIIEKATKFLNEK